MEFVVRIGLGRLFFKYFLERGMVVNGFFGGRNWKELVGEDIDEVAAGSEEVGAFGDVLLVVEEVAEGLVGHLVETGAHVVGCSVRGEDGEALETSE